MLEEESSSRTWRRWFFLCNSRSTLGERKDKRDRRARKERRKTTMLTLRKANNDTNSYSHRRQSVSMISRHKLNMTCKWHSSMIQSWMPLHRRWFWIRVRYRHPRCKYRPTRGPSNPWSDGQHSDTPSTLKAYFSKVSYDYHFIT